jgi:hypothetical protein
MREKRNLMTRHSGKAKKPAAPKGTMEMVDGKSMLQARPPRKQGKR